MKRRKLKVQVLWLRPFFFDEGIRVGLNRSFDTIKSILLLQRKMDHPREDAAVEGDFHLEDYRPIDPIPSSTASIRSGPIQHGIPLMPYIPKPSPPPSQTEQGEFP